MNPIFQSLLQGYSAGTIINHLIQASPAAAKRINLAKKAGNTAEQIVQFLSDKEESNISSSYQTSHRIGAKKKKERDDLVKEALKKGIGASVTALSAYALYKGAPAVMNVLRQNGFLGGAPTHGTPPAPTGPAPTTPGAPPNLPGAGPTPNTPNTPPNTPTPSPRGTPNIPGGGGGSPAAPTTPPPTSPQPTPQEQQAAAIPEIAAANQKQADLDKYWNLAKAGETKVDGKPSQFLKYVKMLSQNGELRDEQTFKDFKKYWDSNPNQLRASPVVEFETFRNRYRSSEKANPTAPKETSTPKTEPAPVQSKLAPEQPQGEVKEWPTKEEWKKQTGVTDEELENFRNGTGPMPGRDVISPEDQQAAIERIQRNKKPSAGKREISEELKESRKKKSAELKESLSNEMKTLEGKSTDEIATLTNYGLVQAAREIDKQSKSGKKYLTFTGNEYKAVGHSDVTDNGEEPYPKSNRESEADEHFLSVIQKYLPIHALYKRAKMTDKNLTSDKFFRGLEKALLGFLSHSKS